MERDWQKDWDSTQRYQEDCLFNWVQEYEPVECDYVKALRYWLQRVRELEQQVRDLKERAEAAEEAAMNYARNLDKALERVRELEEENRRLRKVLEAAAITYNDALIIGRHLNEIERGSE